MSIGKSIVVVFNTFQIQKRRGGFGFIGLKKGRKKENQYVNSSPFNQPFPCVLIRTNKIL